MVLLLFAVYFACVVSVALTQRECSKFVCGEGLVSKAVFLCVNCIVGMTVFFVLAGGRIYVDGKVLFFAFLYAFVCIGNNIGGMYALKYCLAASVTSVQSGGNMVIASAFGFLLWQEAATLPRIAAIVLMLIALYCVFMETKKGQVQGEGSLGKRLLLLGIAGAICAANTIVNKFFVELCGEEHNNSYFFLTNVFMMGYALVYLGIYCLKHPFPKDVVRAVIKPGHCALIAGNTVIGNVQSLMSVLLLGLVDVSVFSTVAPSLGILSGVAVSLILRQKFSKFTCISVALAIAAVVLQAV